MWSGLRYEVNDLRDFKHRLAEAIIWCTPLVSLEHPAQSLRSSALLSGSIYEDRVLLRFLDEPTARAISIEALLTRRAELLRLENRYPITIDAALAGGRLLLFYPDVNLADGAAYQESRGYLDIDNAPPWDSWV